MQARIKIILNFNSLFDESPLSIDEYLKGIPHKTLIDYAIYLCALSTYRDLKRENIFWAFLNKGDIGTDYYKKLTNRMTSIIKEGTEYPVILNSRSSLKFYQYVQNLQLEDSASVKLTDADIRERILKVYLLLNTDKVIKGRDNLSELVIANSLHQEVYSDVNCYYLRYTEIIKSCLFFEFCEKFCPQHLLEFYRFYGINSWQEYIIYLHQIGMLILDKDTEEPVKSITIPTNDKEYQKKSVFFDKFCKQNTYLEDQDFTQIKSFPAYKADDTEDYRIIFEQFFIEKIYKSLYFVFRDINDKFKNSINYIPKFRDQIGLKFSEKILLNRILFEALGKKYKQLGYNELKREGLCDYYIRDGKYVYLFECKDNLIKKEIVETADVDEFINEMRNKFFQNEDGKPKAIQQLINNIISILNGKFVEDKSINVNNVVIYPIIVVHNNLFSLKGINRLINQWYWEEIDKNSIDRKNIRDITVIDIDTLILSQNIISQKNHSIRKLIDEYWRCCKFYDEKSYSSLEDRVNNFPLIFASFRNFMETKLNKLTIFDNKKSKYSRYFK